MLTGLAGTVAIHVGGVLLLLLSVRSTPREFPPSYAVQLVAAPPLSGAARPAPEARSNPVAPPTPKVTPKPAPTKAPVQTDVKPAPAPRTASPLTPLPGETPSTGSDIANVDLKGKAFPYPEYLRNLVAQIYRRWNRQAGSAALTTAVDFVILRDGTVKANSISITTSSRSYSFDLEARGAIDAAAADKAFGPLPAGYPADYLQINFLFTPRRTP